jgi:hypothetical protein
MQCTVQIYIRKIPLSGRFLHYLLTRCISVTLFLVLTNIFNTVTNLSPNTEGMTAIASWMLGKHVISSPPSSPAFKG